MLTGIEKSLIGRVAVVCGSTQGIGREIAIGLAEMGAQIVLIARDEEKLKIVLNELPQNDRQLHACYKADFGNTEELITVSEKIAKTFAVNILINNTGGPAGGPIVDAENDQFLTTFNQHLIANHIWTKAFYPAMVDSGYGRIINVISTSVKIPLKGLGVSNTIRGAVASWAKTMSIELGKFGITVNNVLPGATMTSRLSGIIESKSQKLNIPEKEIAQEMLNEIPMGRFAKPDEVANTALFLASPYAAYINGMSIAVDGGRTGSL